MFQVIVLVCSLGTLPSECDENTAHTVLRGPTVANELMCGLHGQAYIAPTTQAPRENEYIKVKCTRKEPS